MEIIEGSIDNNKKRKNTRKIAILEKLKLMEINDTFNINDFLIEKFNGNIKVKDNYFLRRSFDVIFCNQKKKLIPKEFKCIKGFITRLK